MSDYGHLWADVEAWLISNATVERSALIVSVGAFILSIKGMRHAKRSAQAAEAQAKVAQRQLNEMIRAGRAIEIAELSLINERRMQLDAGAPRVVVAFEGNHQQPRLLPIETLDGTTAPSPPEGRIRADEPRLLGWTIRGLITNEGEVAMHVAPSTLRFIEGVSALTSEHICTPLKLNSNEYLIRPGDKALFEWQAIKRVDEWINLYKDRHAGEFPTDPEGKERQWSRKHRARGCFFVWPAGDPENATIVEMIIDNDAVICNRWAKEKELGVQISKSTYLDIAVRFKRMSDAKSAAELQKLLKLDKFDDLED